MATYIKYIPSYCEGFPPVSFEFDTLSELLEHPEVKWRKDRSDFYGWAISPDEDGEEGDWHLMGLYDEGYVWRVAGSLRGCDDLGLPLWEAKHREKNNGNKD